MSQRSMNILLVEDNAGDARLLREMVNDQTSYVVTLTHVASMLEAEQHLCAHEVDVTMLDLGLPDAQGLAAVRRAHLFDRRTPLVVLTGRDDEALAIQALQEGAQDYLVKGQIETTGLLRALRHAIERANLEARYVVARDRAEGAEALLRDAVDSISEGFVIYDGADRLVMCNENYRALYRGSAEYVTPGVRYADLLRDVLAQGGLETSQGRETEWLAEHLHDHFEAKGAVERQQGDGRWILATDRRMKNGGIAGLRIDVTTLKQAQAALVEEEARLDRAQAIAAIGSWELATQSGRYVWSKEMYRIRGVSATEFAPTLANTSALVHPDDLPLFEPWIEGLMAGQEQNAREIRILHPDGAVRLLRVEGRPIVDADNVVRRLAGTMQDITERRQTEQQLGQAQKMEAIGNLTGGMAHDFNNGLAVIIGNLDLLGRLIKADPAAKDLCDEARNGAQRCSDLIRLLLAFARRQPLHPRLTDVNDLVRSIATLLGRTLGEDIAWRLHLATGLPEVVADPAQLGAALTNLANNARDAMPKGGCLDVTTKTAVLDESYVALHPEVAVGAYVLIEFGDTGTGITPDIIDSIFEPFFTTKDIGEGSGLGLSMVFGFVKQSGGHLTVYSEAGRGAMFRIYLPCAATTQKEGVPVNDLPPIIGGDETVLLVEDNASLRRAAYRQLTELGYQVREAADAEAALVILASGDRVDLLFSDVVMPGSVDGFDLANLATRARRDIRVLLTSGFPGVHTAHGLIEDCPFPLLNKPYGHDELARKVREILDQSAAPA